MIRAGILGGTFDPIHIRHIELAMAARSQYKLDKILIMPDREPPHKNGHTNACADDRFNMVKLAVKDKNGLFASDYELQRTGPTYTSDTLTLLHNKYPDIEWYFIIGSDSVMYMEKWHRPDIIFSLCHLLYIMRIGDIRSDVKDHIRMLKVTYPCIDINEVVIPESPVASSVIRKMIKGGCTDAGKLYLDPAVMNYINNKGLYK